MQPTQTSNSLSKAQIERYWQNGFLCPIPAISTQQCEDWRAELEAIESDWLDNGLPRALNVYKRVNAHLVMPLAYKIAAHSAILDVVEGILGPKSRIQNMWSPCIKTWPIGVWVKLMGY